MPSVSMRALAAAVLSGSAVLAAPAPLDLPAPTIDTQVISTAFPALQNDALIPEVQVLAHGTLPNSPPPPNGSISAEGILNLQFIEFNEIIEVVFFTEFLFNITNDVPGYHIYDDDKRAFIEDNLVAVIAQEQIHAIGAHKNLKSQGATTIDQCIYNFPVSSFREALNFADLATMLTVGTLQDVSLIFAQNRDVGPVKLVASVLPQEGEQSGLYRTLNNDFRTASAKPFLTSSTRDLAFSALMQTVIVSCPNIEPLTEGLKLFGTLNVVTGPQNIPEDQTITVSFDIASLAKSNIAIPAGQWYSAYGTTWSPSTNWASSVTLALVNGLNQPLLVDISNVSVTGSVVTFDAPFPFKSKVLDGLTIAALVVSGTNQTFGSVEALTNSTLAAPALIYFN